LNTPEGRLFAHTLAGGGGANVSVHGERTCSCGCGQVASVTLTVDGMSIRATSPETLDKLLAALAEARAWVWGK